MRRIRPAAIPLFCAAILAASTAFAQSKDYPVHAVPLTAIHLNDAFWAPRLETNRTITLWHVFHQAEQHGELDNFAKAAGTMPPGPGFQGSSPARDSDAYKCLEGAAYAIMDHPDPKLEDYCDKLIANIAAAQEPDGYLYTARKLTAPEKMPAIAGPTRFGNEKDSHETYVMGLLCEAGIAYDQATGKKTLLDTGIKSADLLNQTFGPADNQLHVTSGHEEIELALARLYLATGNDKYIKLAQYFVDQRGRHTPSWGQYAQDQKPVIDQTQAVGHAVRANYLYSGVTDLAALTGNPQYAKAIDALWHSVVEKRMYITGGCGARGNGEAYGNDYELPNLTAYNETCAAIANAYWQQRLFLLYQDAKYVDVLERTLYNQFLAGQSLSGDKFFYTNVLESDGTRTKSQRMPWFQWPCCLTNDVRMMPIIPSYAYASKEGEAWVNLFIAGTADLKLGEGANAKNIKIADQTNYPWDGKIKLPVTPATAADFTLHVRIPGWARGEPIPGDLYRYAEKDTPPYTLTINGKEVQAELSTKGYVDLKRTWTPGDTLELNLPMPIHRVLANEALTANRGKVALERGPLVYCIEAIDNNGKARTVTLPNTTELTPEPRPDLLGGITTLHSKDPATPFTAIPYYAWSNRGDGEMCVWINSDTTQSR